MIRLLARLVVVVVLLAGVASVALPAGAQDTGISGPTLTLDQTSVDPGQQITVIFTGWTGRLVTLSVCGNLAKRGSTDCNMPASQGVRLYHVDDSPLTSFVISEPPATCPCVIRASSDTGEVAYAPIEIRGMATGPVVDPFSDESPLAVTVDAEPMPEGVVATVKSWLGGATPYEVTVKVHNQATEEFSAVKVHGAVGRNSEVDVASFDVEPGAMAPGQTWTGTVTVDVPAPVLGNFEWRAVASGAGPVTETSTPMRAVPWLLVVLILVLVADLVAVVVRAVQRRRARKVDEQGEQGDIGASPTAGLGGEPGGTDLGALPPPPQGGLVGAGV